MALRLRWLLRSPSRSSRASSDPRRPTADAPGSSRTCTPSSWRSTTGSAAARTRGHGPTQAGIVVGAPEHGTSAVQIEVGGRYVHGWGRFKQDLAGSTGLPANNSRLTWKDVETDGGEVFWRLDTPHRVMVKGLWGTGTGNSGRINDEDWGLDREDDEGNLVLVQPYQNTVSPADSKLRYFTVDLGYNLFAGPGYKVSPFVGYSYFRQSMSAFGVTLIDFSAGGRPAGQRPGAAAVRDLGVPAAGHGPRPGLAPRLRLNADAAYLPYVHFDGVDDHPLRVGDGASTRSPQEGTAAACSSRQRSATR